MILQSFPAICYRATNEDKECVWEFIAPKHYTTAYRYPQVKHSPMRKVSAMRVKIDRDVCPAHLSFCEQCLGKFLKEPLGYERRCFIEFEDSEPDLLTIELHSGDHDIIMTLTEEERKLVGGEGWDHFVNFTPEQYRDHPPK